MKAKVDPNTCIGCELCVSLCPSVFSMNDDLVSEAITAELTEEQISDAEQAMEQCPVAAISME
ncbi:MAG: ferredoxin [Sarcina sp.]